MLFASPVLLSVGAVALVMLFPLGFTYLMKSMAYLLALKSGDIECDKDKKLEFVNFMAYNQIDRQCEQLLEDQKGQAQRFSEIMDGLLAEGRCVLENLKASPGGGTFAQRENRLIEELRALFEKTSAVPFSRTKVTFGGREYYLGTPVYSNFQEAEVLESICGNSEFNSFRGSEGKKYSDVDLEKLRSALDSSFNSSFNRKDDEWEDAKLRLILEGLKGLFLSEDRVKRSYLEQVREEVRGLWWGSVDDDEHIYLYHRLGVVAE